MTALYSILHMLVDGVCAFAMFGNFVRQEQGYLYILLYNFCAFALQMPFGAALDILSVKNGKRVSFAAAVLGVAFTLIGAVTHPVILGIGNALFHIGGGVGTIREDGGKGWRGRGLGVFVAPGALGLYLGTQLAGNGAGTQWLWGACVCMTAVCVGAGCVLWRSGPQGAAWDSAASNSAASNRATADSAAADKPVFGSPESVVPLAACLFLVVVLRSYIGMAVAFPWKTTVFAAVLSTLAVVFGKVAGGFAAARFGYLKTAVVSLTAAAVFYLFSGFLPAGLAALFLFNMTMPITLYLLIRRLARRPGFSFGLLTFGLFLGFLPEYFGLRAWQNYSIMGCAGSLVSLILLIAGISRGRMGDRK